MPIVPGTKIWIRNKELDNTISEMERVHPLERASLAAGMAIDTIRRQRQARSNFQTVYRFILNTWFKERHIVR